jgi:Rieske Fe-S protein
MTSTPRRLDRRTVLGCAAVYGVAGPILVACSSGSDGSGADTGTPAEESSGAGGQAGGSGGAGGEVLVAAADVPVGGGVVLSDLKVVVVQPEEGDFRGYTAVCTHQGCTVGEVSGGTINCPCHGSAFAIADGSVADGPATNPLAEVQVKVKGGDVVRA